MLQYLALWVPFCSTCTQRLGHHLRQAVNIHMYSKTLGKIKSADNSLELIFSSLQSALLWTMLVSEPQSSLDILD